MSLISSNSSALPLSGHKWALDLLMNWLGTEFFFPSGFSPSTMFNDLT